MSLIPMPDSCPHEQTLTQLEVIQNRLQGLETELADAQRLAMLGTLAAGVLHEVNNILTPVLSYAHLASSNRDDADLHAKAFGKIITGIESASEVVDTMLNFASDRGDSTEADLAAAVTESIACLGRDPAKDGIEIVTRVPLATMVQIRPLALQQVLMNLLLNACSAMSGAPGRITVSGNSGAGDTTILTVVDNGPGIDADIRDSLFDAFVSGHSSTCGKDRPFRGGSGLGLTVTQQLIEGAGGSISVESEPGQGASFTIILPSQRPPQAMAG